MATRPPVPLRPQRSDDDDDPLEDRGRGLGLRLLALLGAFSFLMLGISSLAPLLQPAPSPELPDQRRHPVGYRSVVEAHRAPLSPPSMSIARDQCRMGNPTPTTSHLMATPAAAGFRAGMAEAVAAAA